MAGYHDPMLPNPLGLIGTTHHWAPEITWDTRRLSPQNDVWDLAAILHELAHAFGPVVSAEVTAAKWFAKNTGKPYPDHWDATLKTNY